MPRGRPPGIPKTGGRQKGSTNKVPSEIKEIARQYGPQAVQELARLAGLVGEGDGRAESEQARIGALNGLLDRGYGKPTQAVAVAGEGGEGAVKHEISINWLTEAEAKARGWA
jgi:hypothetical protein